MPKVANIDSKTGLKTGASQETSGGRTIKARTQLTPERHIVSTPQTAASEDVKTQGQPNNTEANPEVKVLDPHHEALAKKESAIRARERDIQAKEASLEARIKQSVEEALSKYTGQLKQSPLDVLDKLGVTYDQLVEQAVNMPDPASRALQQKLETIEANQKRYEEESKKSIDSQREAAVKQISYDVQELIETDASFETIKVTESISDVVDLITRTFDETGKLLSIDHAAKMVEDELLEEAVKIASLSKVKAKLAPPISEALANAKQQSPQQATTLTNQMTSKRPMTARERAIAAFKGEKF